MAYACKSWLQQMGDGMADQHGMSRLSGTTMGRHRVQELAAQGGILNTGNGALQVSSLSNSFVINGSLMRRFCRASSLPTAQTDSSRTTSRTAGTGRTTTAIGQAERRPSSRLRRWPSKQGRCKWRRARRTRGYRDRWSPDRSPLPTRRRRHSLRSADRDDRRLSSIEACPSKAWQPSRW